ncbi:hypothetical protein VTL71DRAFT_183 [Oculimacula yallundae]|uniref:Zn(2)-C6 fungal-type domain-containing protein n=1 Tax=Oculimacula yallundae TaxID=86028 RepID=A0ABR4CZH9_9HELO
MVAVPRSKGCLICRKRRVKCDEVRPSCSQCRRGGRQCSGYDLPMTFITQQPRLKAQRNIADPRKKKSKDEPVKFLDSSLETSSCSTELVSNGPWTKQRTEYQSRIDPTIHCPLLNLSQLTTSFVHTLFPPTYLPPNLSFFASWLWQIPSHLSSTNPLLTTSAKALSLGFFGSETKAPTLEHESRVAYSRALWYLSKAIEDVDTGLNTETLCATMLLGFYECEIYMRTQDVSWVTHAGGAGKLMQIRGAQRHREGFDYIMFLGFRGIIIAEAVASGKPCFLDAEDWRSIVSSHESYQTSSEIFQQHNEFSNLFASVPGIAVDLVEATKYSPEDKSRISIIEHASSLRNAFKIWHERFTFSHPMSSLALESHNSSSTNQITTSSPTTHDEVWLSAWLCAYYACQIMLNTRLSLLTNIFTSTENAELINKLCIAVGNCSRVGNSGGQCLAFALPVALSLCKGELEGWILEGLSGKGGDGDGDGDWGNKGVNEGQIEMLRGFVRVKL